MDAVSVRPVWSAADLDAVHRLTHDAFVDKGYASPTSDRRLRYGDDLEAAPETMVLLAEVEGAVVGTVSVSLDGPCGLYVDRLFPADCQRVRAEGLPVGCVWRLVTSPEHRTRRGTVLALAASTAEVLGRFGVATALSAFHPRHVPAYRRIFEACIVARLDWVDAVQSPGVLVRMDVDAARRRWPLPPNPALATLTAERRRLLDALGRAAA